jgi:tetratricopeptide (TPR) repeat protein
MKCVCLPDGPGQAATVVDHVRLFRNHSALRFSYRVHEQILPAVRRLGSAVRWSNVAVHHVGYQDRQLRTRKLQRDLRLLHLEDQDHPGDPFTLFNLGSVCQELGRPAEALPYLRRSLERSQPADSIVRKLYALLVQCHRRLGQPEEALAACRAGRVHHPTDQELLFLEGQVLREGRDLAGAELSWLRLLATREGDHFGSVDAGLAGYKTRHHLALLYQEQGRLEPAEKQWRLALAERLDFQPARLGLADVYLGQQRWPALEQVIGELAAEPQGRLEAGVLRARQHLARREFDLAQQQVQAVIAEAPALVWPRVVLTHVLLQEGRDLEAAEKALRAVLELDPEHVQARHNLSLLLAQKGGSNRSNARDVRCTDMVNALPSRNRQ